VLVVVAVVVVSVAHQAGSTDFLRSSFVVRSSSRRADDA
jgi:hypothetical protein